MKMLSIGESILTDKNRCFKKEKFRFLMKEIGTFSNFKAISSADEIGFQEEECFLN